MGGWQYASVAIKLPTHTEHFLRDPKDWQLHVSRHDGGVRRLVVFVHGFIGHAVGTWANFHMAGRSGIWWQEADLLFVGYSWRKDRIVSVAHRIRNNLPRFYPTPFALPGTAGAPRPDYGSPYEELIVAGHSLGGLIVRRAVYDSVVEWIDRGRPATERPALLNAKVRLFSPCIAGYELAGNLGLAEALGGTKLLEPILRRSPAYRELKAGSGILTDTREQTEKHASTENIGALRAEIVWASPDNVVLPLRYGTDPVDDSWDGTTHVTVCKPNQRFSQPFKFIESGTTR
jgi:hypothetical protein